ncbi:MAG: UDP-N-acetylmuramoyl-L-alanyl-D-glutamate--2,6-diaminopimelate ligase [Verrucomicrobiota bacterium]|nr:UDP-N-acetylmuramoyl-L-alanyl-D-glutamate--2,6-diaminopimelate ligase [Verrucomicrobiota bacterium]
MLLSEIIPHIDVEKVTGNTSVPVSGIAHDSRKVLPGNVYIAITGLKLDGAQFAQQAIDQGAVAIVQEAPVPDSSTTAHLRVSHARRAMAQIAQVFHGYPDGKLKVVGITGTNGKTTTTFIIKHLLAGTGCKSGLIGTVVYDDGEKEMPAARTTPESTEVFAMMSRMIESGCKACVMEVSSHALDQGRVEGIDFDVAIFSNLTQDHLDYHQTFEAYFDAKSLLFRNLGKGKKEPTALINLDDSRATELISRVNPVAKVLTYGFAESADMRAVLVTLKSRETKYKLHYAGAIYEVFLPLAGRHNIYNSLAALGTAVALKMDINAAVKALANIPFVPGRLETVVTGMPVDIFVDYAHTDDALKNVLSTLRETSTRRVITVFGCGGDRDSKKRALMGRVAAEWSDHTVVTSDNPRKENPSEIIAAICLGFDGKKNFEVLEDRREAIYRALQIAQDGDTVLIAGKGHETYQEFANEVVPFDDRETVRELAAILLASKGDL